MEELLYRIKESMRISHDALDLSIISDLESCALDMERVGIQPFHVDENGVNQTKFRDKLVEKAGELYCKWQCDFQGKGEQYEKSYTSLRDALSLSGEYGR